MEAVAKIDQKIKLGDSDTVYSESRDADTLRRCRILGELIARGLSGKTETFPEEISREDSEWLCQATYENMMDPVILPQIIDYCEEAGKENLRSRVHYSMIRSLIQMRSATEIGVYFEKEKIRHQFLKGTMMKRIYPNYELRDMGDIDIVVDESQIEEAESVLTKLGYTKGASEDHHHCFLQEPFLVVELHWDLYDRHRDRRQYLYFRDRSCRKALKGREFGQSFDSVDFYIYMIAHSARHFYETGCGIRHLVDVYVYCTKKKEELEPERLRKGLEASGLVAFERKIRELAFAWLEQRPLTEEQVNLLMYMIDSGVHGKSENGIWAMLAEDSLSSGEEKNAKFSFLFPSYTNMKELYPWLEKRPYLLPAGWVMRALRGLRDREAVERAKKVRDMDGKEAQKMIELYKSMELRLARD